MFAIAAACHLSHVQTNALGHWFEGAIGDCKRMAAILGCDVIVVSETTYALRWALCGTYAGEIVTLPGIGVFAHIDAAAKV